MLQFQGIKLFLVQCSDQFNYFFTLAIQEFTKRSTCTAISDLLFTCVYSVSKSMISAIISFYTFIIFHGSQSNLIYAIN